MFTEHYCAIQADVPDPDDSGTQANTALVSALSPGDVIAAAGEAGSHGVASTVHDLAGSLGDDRLVSKIVLLQDAVSPVGGFKSLQADSVAEMTARGMTLSTTRQFMV